MKTTILTLTRCIQEVESRSEAEVALVIRNHSGLYRDVDFLIGALAALGLLLFKLFSEIEFHPNSVPLPLIVAFVCAARLSQGAGRFGPRRYLTTKRRREAQVAIAAREMFREKQMDLLPDGIGVLLYFSALEQRAELVCGPRVKVALGEQLEPLRAQLQTACGSSFRISDSLTHLSEFLRTFGVILEQSMPCDGLGNPNHLADSPDIEGHT